eukprot:scaffold300_cov258-Pinguiococcus_pyrenoidosus.AAC.71
MRTRRKWRRCSAQAGGIGYIHLQTRHKGILPQKTVVKVKVFSSVAPDLSVRFFMITRFEPRHQLTSFMRGTCSPGAARGRRSPCSQWLQTRH